MSGQVWISVIVKHQTDLALLVEGGMGPNVWLAKSLILDYSDEDYRIGDCIEIELPEWLAIDKDLV